MLWPYGYTTANTTGNLGVDAQAAFATLGQADGATNGYTPEQASDLYIADGTIIDWMWATHGIFSYTIEMYPPSSGSGGGFYPPDEQIVPQTTRNREAVLMLSEYADCVYRVIGKQAQYCGGGGGGTTVYSDTFETATGWTTNPSGTDTATTGAWERGDPAGHQLVRRRSSWPPRSAAPTTWSPVAAAGASAGAFDIDGGADEHPLAGDHPAVDRDADALPVVVPRPRQQRVVGGLLPGEHRPQWWYDGRCSPGPAPRPTLDAVWTAATAEPQRRTPVSPSES